MAVEKFIPIKSEDEPEIDERLEAFSAPCEGKEPYVLMVLGDSMAPEFQAGDVVVIEPHNMFKDGSYVVAFYNEEYIFRKLRMVGGDRYYLEAENHAYPAHQLENLDQIKGVITQRKRPGGGRKNMKNYT